MNLISAETVQKHTQTSGVRTEIDEILAPVLLAQRIYGQQILDPSWSWRNYALNHICKIILLTYVVIGTIDFLQNTNDILLFSEAIITLIITFVYTIKFTCFALYRSTFSGIYVVAKTSLYGIIKEISPARATRLIRLVRNMTKAQFALVIIPCLNYLFRALWFYYRGTRVTLSKTTSTLMPMTTPYHEIGLVLHLIYLIMMAFGTLVTDFWFIFFTNFLCTTCDSAVEILQVERLVGETDTPYAKRLNQALGKFYSVHVKLMQYLNTLNEIYKWQVLVPLGSILSLTCVFLLVMSEEVNWQLAAVMLPASCEIFAYNVMGERIKTKANDMNMALFNFDWTSLKLKDRKSYGIIVCYMNKDFCVRTAVGIELSLLTLSSFYKGSYQIFAVLNTMKN